MLSGKPRFASLCETSALTCAVASGGAVISRAASARERSPSSGVKAPLALLSQLLPLQTLRTSCSEPDCCIRSPVGATQAYAPGAPTKSSHAAWDGLLRMLER
jgi:hypothetical protein